jgi:Fe-S-cluster containining protein
MNCRAGCGACCVAPSISSAIPGMQEGKPAGMRCVQLDADNLCLIFGQPGRPRVCGSFQSSAETCGSDSLEAMKILDELEELTRAR